MRKQIAAANWKMNLTQEEGAELLESILKADPVLTEDKEVVIAVPFPYLSMASAIINGRNGFSIAAQNCSDRKNGAFTGEVSAAMLQSLGITFCIIGHSERREYFMEDDSVLARKVDICLQYGIHPIFCCGEALEIREQGNHNFFVEKQLEASLFHLSPENMKAVVIAYEPIWAIGTGKTATTEQAQEMHHHIRSVLTGKYGEELSRSIPILYGGSVKAGNAVELFSAEDVDGGLVGGASLVAQDFVQIIKALKDKPQT